MFKIRNKSVATITVAVALALGISFAPQTGATEVPQAVVACKKATIGGKHKCIAAGQYCARRYESDYNDYGYTCSKRDKRGRYHLKKL